MHSYPSDLAFHHGLALGNSSRNMHCGQTHLYQTYTNTKGGVQIQTIYRLITCSHTDTECVHMSVVSSLFGVFFAKITFSRIHKQL